MEENSFEYAEEKRLYAELLLSEVEQRFGSQAIYEKKRDKTPFDFEDTEKDKVCCFTGSRPEKLTRTPEECKRLLVRAIMDSYEQGYRIYISGMADGVDCWAAMAVLTMRCFYPEVRLVTAPPFPSRRRGGMEDLNTMICALADLNVEVSGSYWPGAYDKRNKWMVDHSGRLIALMDDQNSGSGRTLRYAQKNGLETLVL